MLKQALFLLVLIFCLMLSVLADSAANSNIYVQCSEHYFTSMTSYESNVNSLFTSIIDSSSMYNFNKFEISPPEYSQNDVVYGLFQCRGDLSSPNCKDCVTNSISQLKTNCPSSIGGGIQLDGCFVKYDNESFFGGVDKMEVVKTCGPSIGYNSDVLNRIDDALRYLIAGNGKYFRAGDYGSIEGMTQCVQDLSVTDCQDCLTEACGRLRSECETSAWGNMYLGKCYIIYVDQDDHSHGYNGTSSSNESSDRGKIKLILRWIAIISGVGGSAYAIPASIKIYGKIKVEQKKKKQPEEIIKVSIEKIEKVIEAVVEKPKEPERKLEKKPDCFKPPQCYPDLPPHYYACQPTEDYHCRAVQNQEGCTIM